MSRPTALVLRALGLGDFLTGLPALALLRRSLPGFRIVLAAPLVLEPLARLAGSVDDMVPGAESLRPLADAPRFDPYTGQRLRFHSTRFIARRPSWWMGSGSICRPRPST